MLEKKNGSPLQCSCLENPMDRGAWWASVHVITKSRTQLRGWTQKSFLLSSGLQFFWDHLVLWLSFWTESLPNRIQPASLPCCCCYSVAKSCLTLQPHGLQHARLPCLSPTSRACSNSCPSRQWCHPIISSSVFPFSSCLQSFPASGSFPMSLFFTLGDQSIGASASASVLLMNIQGWFPLGLTGLISLLSKGLSRIFSNTTIQRHHSLALSLYGPTLTSIHDYWKIKVLTIQTFVGKVMSLLYNMLSRLVIAFLLRSKCLLISWLQSLSTVILEPRKIKSVTVSIFSPSICYEIMGLDAMIL